MEREKGKKICHHSKSRQGKKTFRKKGTNKKAWRGRSQDGSVQRLRVRVSPQLGHLQDTGGGPQCPRRQEEPPSETVGCGGTEGGGEVEARQDQRP